LGIVFRVTDQVKAIDIRDQAGEGLPATDLSFSCCGRCAGPVTSWGAGPPLSEIQKPSLTHLRFEVMLRGQAPLRNTSLQWEGSHEELLGCLEQPSGCHRLLGDARGLENQELAHHNDKLGSETTLLEGVRYKSARGAGCRNARY
jgi:hypothetical protein